MTPEQQRVIDQLRAEGYAIAIWYPEELEGVNPGEFEMDVVEKGNDQLSIMATMDDGS